MAEDCCAGLLEILPPRFFKALSDPSRLAVLGRLASLGCSASVTKIAECCPQNLSVISRHLATLREAGILQAERRGKEVVYALDASQFAATLREIADGMEKCCT